MKILFFIDNLGPGGKQRRLVELIKRLCQYPNLEMNIVLTEKEIIYKDIFSTKIKIHFTVRKYLKRDPLVFYQFYKITKNFKPDIIHVWGNLEAIYALPSKILLKIPLLNSQITNATPFFNKILNHKLSFPFSDKILANSYAGLRAYNAPKNKSSVIYNGFDFNRINELGDPSLIKIKYNIKTKYIVGMASSFMDRKDYTTYFEAAKEVLKNRNDVTFIAVGDGDNSKYKKIIEKNNDNKIIILGHQRKVEDIMNICDIGILVSNVKLHGEGIPNSVLEFMALSKPVIANDCGGTNELVINNRNGYLIEKQDFKELSGRIIDLLDNDFLRKTFGLESRKIVVEKFSITEMVNSFIYEYELLTKDKIEK